MWATPQIDDERALAFRAGEEPQHRSGDYENPEPCPQQRRRVPPTALFGLAMPAVGAADTHRLGDRLRSGLDEKYQAGDAEEQKHKPG
jgi:hypothetical protein